MRKSGLFLGVVLALAGIAHGQEQTKQSGQTVPPSAAVSAGAGTDQDQTPIPVDPKHQKDIDGDVKAGKAYTAELEKTLKFSKDKVGQERLEHVGRIIANIARRNQVTVLYGDKRLSPFDYTFHLIEGADVNAFSVPGGSVYVNEGLLKFVESDDELAAVLAHEVSHAAFRHYATMSKQSSWIDALALPAMLAMILSRSDAAYGAAMATQMIGQSYQSGWSVEAETAADYGAVQFLTKSPYQPVAMLTFMERLADRDSLTGHNNWTIYTTHPPTELRASRVLQELNQINAPIRRSLVTRSLSARMDTKADGSVELWFGSTKIHVFRDSAASTRAAIAVAKLNDFFDQVPEMYQVETTEDGTLVGKGRELFRVMPTDSPGSTEAVQDAYQALRKAVFDVRLRVSLSTRHTNLF